MGDAQVRETGDAAGARRYLCAGGFTSTKVLSCQYKSTNTDLTACAAGRQGLRTR